MTFTHNRKRRIDAEKHRKVILYVSILPVALKTELYSLPRSEKIPWKLTIGEGKLIRCFETSLVGMTEGEQRTVHIPPEDAMGARRPELVSELPLHMIPEQDEDLKVGSSIQIKDEKGRDVKATVTHLSDQAVIIDANHPLAGETLVFDINLIEFV